MRVSLLYILLCILQICLTSQPLKGQVDSNFTQVPTLDENSYDNLVEELDWSKTKKALRLKPVDESQEEEKDKEKEESTRPNFNIGGTGIQIVGYIAVLLLVGFIIYLILDNVKFDPRLEKSEFEMTNLETIDDIELIDARLGLREALEREDYKSALSMHYILVLQFLSAEERIAWEPYKTNRDYIREMRGDMHGVEFADISRAYDLSLYGDRPFGREDYQMIRASLELLSSPQVAGTHE